MATVTSTVTLNPAFLQEIKEDHQELWSLLNTLREILGPLPTRHASPHTLVQLLNQLRDRVAMHFALEEAYGYFDDPLRVAPQLDEKAEALREQHSGLFCALLDIVDHAEGLLYHETSNGTLSKVSRAFRRFHESFKDHEDAETNLLLEALDEDIGVGD